MLRAKKSALGGEHGQAWGAYPLCSDSCGASVGRVLHVATGHPRTMVVSVDTCHGPRAYVGLVSSYYEPVTNDFHRMQDTEWVSVLGTKPPERPAWAADLSAK